MSAGGVEKGERIPSRFHTVSMKPDVGLELMYREIMTWAEIKSQTQPTEPPRQPQNSWVLFQYLEAYSPVSY